MTKEKGYEQTKAEEWEDSSESRKDRPDLEPKTYDSTSNTTNGNGWQKWKIYVLETIDKLETKLDKIEERSKESQFWCTEEITRLKVKSTIWGAVAGFAVSMIITVGISVGAGYLTKNVDMIGNDCPTVEEHIEKEHPDSKN